MLCWFGERRKVKGRKVAQRRMLRAVALAFVFATLFVFSASYASAQQMTPQEKALLDRVGRWKVVNFSIFVVLLGWAVVKYSPRFFNARSADIQKAIKDATGLKLEADYRYSEIDRKMATLAEEVKRLRAQAGIELEREHGRVRQETAQEIDHINRQIANEIDALRTEAAGRVRRRTAQLALGLAERRLQDRFAAGEPDNLLYDFGHLVERGEN
jgi:F0F1-type ATP synthase membrane subunit b/b'